MVFNSTGEKDTTRTILYDGSNNDIGNTEFTSLDERPWDSYRSNVTKVTFENSIVPKSTDFWFTYFSNLSSINNIELLDTSNVISMKSMFGACSSLSSLDLSTFDTGSVTNMYSMFYLCTSLKNLKVNGFDTHKVTNMAQMFGCCINLDVLDLSSFDTQNVTTMQNMFFGHSSTGDMKLKEIKGLEGFDTSKVENMSTMFQRCINFKELDLRNFNTEKVSSMSTMFFHCDSLERIYVSDNFVTTSVSASNGMFQHCRMLVGNTGTKYDSSKYDVSMAKIDTAVYDEDYNLISGTPGYFSTK